MKEEAEPIATGVVRELSGETTLRDADCDVDYLPPHVSKRSCYGRFCLNRGWLITSTNKGVAKSEPLIGREQQEIPSLTAYMSFWDKHYKNLKVRRPTKDVCGDCYNVYNQSKYQPSNNNDSFLDQSAVESDEGEKFGSIGDVDQAVEDWESILLNAALHVQRARAQRKLLHNKQDKAINDRLNDVQHSNRQYCLIADYSQNLSLPHFRSSQPGETYFYTPLTLYLFGVVDTSNNNHLTGHLFREGDGKKGGNSVASLLIKTLQHLNIIQEDDDGRLPEEN
jgi:hypothetical protein